MSNIVRTRLIADGTVAGMVGGRVYFLQLQQDCAMPAISTRIIGEEPQIDFDGSVSITNQIWQIDCWGDSPSSVEPLADAVETALAVYGVDFSAIKTDRESDFEDSTGLYRVSLDYSLWI